MPDTTPIVVAEQRCIHDLLLISCIWCTPRPGVEDLTGVWDEPEPRHAERDHGWTQAVYRGTCGACAADIKAGDTIRWTKRQGAVCKECGDADS